MKRIFPVGVFTLALLICLSGCCRIGSRSGSLSTIYFVTAALSILSLLCCLLAVKGDRWMLLLFGAVCVVNCGYYALSVSDSLATALWANRVAYLGSAFLPLCMLMIILRVAGIKYKRWLPILLSAVGIAIFLIAATPGYSDVYYSSVELGSAGGSTVLIKEYGPLHVVYLFYLMSYTLLTVGAAVYAGMSRRLGSPAHVAILNIAVFINVGLWLLEQLVKTEFELLSVSYVISELFLLGLYMMQEESIRAHEKKTETPAATYGTVEEEKMFAFKDGLARLTPTERLIYDMYLQGKSSKDIMSAQRITENTLKYHNKNIYGKLGVKSRKELTAIAKHLEK